eukprot:1161501-Pelagomonas_calceolata.AAC.7
MIDHVHQRMMIVRGPRLLSWPQVTQNGQQLHPETIVHSQNKWVVIWDGDLVAKEVGATFQLIWQVCPNLGQPGTFESILSGLSQLSTFDIKRRPRRNHTKEPAARQAIECETSKQRSPFYKHASALARKDLIDFNKDDEEAGSSNHAESRLILTPTCHQLRRRLLQQYLLCFIITSEYHFKKLKKT